MSNIEFCNSFASIFGIEELLGQRIGNSITRDKLGDIVMQLLDSDLDESAIGNKIIKLFGLKLNENGLINVGNVWGTKTPIGLTLVLRRILSEAGQDTKD